MNVLRTSELPWANALTKGAYAQRRKALGTGAISSGLWELPPGKKSFPLHVHHVTEEALFAISGTAKVRTPAGETALGPGDWVTFPPGGEAHQLINDGTEPFVYLALSTGKGADVVEYPESGKVAASVQGPNAKRFVFRENSQVDYFDGDRDA